LSNDLYTLLAAILSALSTAIGIKKKYINAIKDALDFASTYSNVLENKVMQVSDTIEDAKKTLSDAMKLLDEVEKGNVKPEDIKKIVSDVLNTFDEAKKVIDLNKAKKEAEQLKKAKKVK